MIPEFIDTMLVLKTIFDTSFKIKKKAPKFDFLFAIQVIMVISLQHWFENLTVAGFFL